MSLADLPLDDPPTAPASSLALARERLATPVLKRPSLGPTLASAFVAAFAALAAAAAVILGAPALGAPSQAVFAPVSHVAGE